MATEYRLSYTAEEINEKLGKIDEIPEVTTQDNGKFIRVVDGKYSLVDLTDVSEVGAWV